MSEEKLYAVKNAKGLYLSFSDDQHYRWREGQIAATTSQRIAHDLCTQHGGHVAVLTEEPEKVVVSPEEAELVKNCLWTNLQDAFLNNINLLFRGRRPDDITRLKSALTNGYTVKKEKKYNVKVPHVPLYYWKKPNGGLGVDDLNVVTSDDDTDDFEFTEAEIEHYGLQDCEKEEVTDDDD